MIKTSTIRLRSSAFPVLVLSYTVLMMHYVFSRALRDSMLGSRLAVAELPSLTVLGTLLAISLSIVCSFFMRTRGRLRVIRIFYSLNALSEVIIALGHRSHPWMLNGYYIEVSASTAIGLSLIWVLIGDWTSNCNHGDTNRVPLVLISGTAAGMFSGFGLVYLPMAASLRDPLLMLAAMDLSVSLLLLLHRDGSCIPRGSRRFEGMGQGIRRHWSSGVVRMLAIVTILGAATSTLLDLVFRARVADHFSSQAERIQFMGSLQGFLCLGALLAQFVVRRLTAGPWARRCLVLYPGIVAAAVLAGTIAPVFYVFEILRIGEYSLRNSASRCGIEMVYSALPDSLRVEVRPMVDVVGERLGDMFAAGLLAMLIQPHGSMNLRGSLFIVALLAMALLLGSVWLLRRVDRLSTENEQPLPLQKLAQEGAVLA